MKKNTMLSLDEELVKKARENNLNISKIAEESLKKNILSRSHFGKKAAEDFGKYLKDLKIGQEIYFLPFKIKSINAEKIGPIKKLNIDLKEKNLVYGPNASGKSILLRAISSTFGNKEFFSEWVNENSKIEIELDNEKNKVKTNFKEDPKCILIDGSHEVLEGKYFLEFLKYLNKLKSQIIITGLSIPKRINDFGFNLIKLDSEGGVSIPCNNCGKELLGISADKEITLFYKDANKNYNFCSRECLTKFIGKLK